jgi:nitrite reductase (NADH) small subunit
MQTQVETRHERAEKKPPQAWVPVCELEDVVPGTGVAALINGVQVAIVRPRNDDVVYALSNYDPFSQAYVLSRGIVGDKAGVLKIASPIFKQSFDLQTGQCLDDSSVRVATYPTRVNAGRVEILLT